MSLALKTIRSISVLLRQAYLDSNLSTVVLVIRRHERREVAATAVADSSEVGETPVYICPLFQEQEQVVTSSHQPRAKRWRRNSTASSGWSWSIRSISGGTFPADRSSLSPSYWK